MKILIKDNFIDFESPFYMDDDQLDVFIEGMQKIFSRIKEHEIKELDREISDVERHPQKWTPEELVYLLSDKSHEEIAKILNRENFSVKSKRMVWLLPFRNWALKKGYIIEGHFKNLKEAINEYERTKR